MLLAAFSHQAGKVRDKVRPMVRYHGGKWKLAPWIISHFPHHRVYVEPFGGGGSVFLRKSRSYAEIYNDLDGDIVNVFRVARDHGNEPKDSLFLTPFSREEFIDSYFPSENKIEQARRTIVRSFMGFGSASVTKNGHVSKRFTSPSTGFRSNSNRSGTTPAHDWKNYAEVFDLLIHRMRGIVIENRDAKEVMLAQDGEQTLHYVDPPYVSGTRDKGADYQHEMTDEDHIKLAEFLKRLKGTVVLSGYNSEMYSDLYSGWSVSEKETFADGGSARVERIWMNKKISGMLL